LPSRSLSRPVLRRAETNHTCQACERCRRFKSDSNPQTRAPSIGSMLDLATEWSSSRSLSRFRDSLRTLVARREEAPLVLKGIEPPRRATAPPLGLPRGSPRRDVEGTSHRLLQPTFDTCTRQLRSVLESTSSPRGDHRTSLRRSRSCLLELPTDAGPPCGNPGPEQIRVLTTRFQLRPFRALSRRVAPVREECVAGHLESNSKVRCLRAAAFSTASTIAESCL